MELTVENKADLINLVNIGNVGQVLNYFSKFENTEQYNIAKLESKLNSYEKYKLMEQVNNIEYYWNFDKIIENDTRDMIKTKLLLYYKPEVILLTSDTKETNFVETLIRNNSFGSATVLKLLFDKVIENHYDISDFKFRTNCENVLIDVFTLEEGNFDCFKEVMTFIKKKYPLYDNAPHIRK